MNRKKGKRELNTTDKDQPTHLNGNHHFVRNGKQKEVTIKYSLYNGLTSLNSLLNKDIKLFVLPF